jgi:hypothetical protein
MLGPMRVALLIALVACGPVVYVSEVTRNASDAVDAARAAHADKYSPYYWTRATEYLHEAREAANRYGRLATEAANQAVTESAKHPAERHDVDTVKKIAPAKDSE